MCCHPAFALSCLCVRNEATTGGQFTKLDRPTGLLFYFWLRQWPRQLLMNGGQYESNGQVAHQASTYFKILLTHSGQDKMAATLADDIFIKCIFLNEDVWISIRVSLKIVPEVPIYNKPALVQIMAWCLTGGKPLSEPMMAYFTDRHIHASLDLNELSPERINRNVIDQVRS